MKGIDAMSDKKIAIAIDGPAGAGKSTIAKAVAAELGYLYIDTGALYRTIGLYTVRKGADPKDIAAVLPLLPEIHIRLAHENGVQQVYLDEENVSDAIRTPEMGMAASAVSAHGEVRAFLLDLQRQFAREYNVLMDGRDISKCTEAQSAEIRNTKIGIVVQDFALVENYSRLFFHKR